MRRIEDRIRRLCTQLLATKDDEELRPILAALREALRRHVEVVRQRFAGYPFVSERRQRNGMPAPEAQIEAAIAIAKPEIAIAKDVVAEPPPASNVEIISPQASATPAKPDVKDIPPIAS